MSDSNTIHNILDILEAEGFETTEPAGVIIPDAGEVQFTAAREEHSEMNLSFQVQGVDCEVRFYLDDESYDFDCPADLNDDVEESIEDMLDDIARNF